MASRRKKIKNRLKKLQKRAGRKDSNGALIEKGRGLLLYMVETDAPTELVAGLSAAIDAALQGDSGLLTGFLDLVSEREVFSDPSTEIAFPFSSAKAADLLRQASSANSPNAMLELCKKALVADPESADALVLIGDHQDDSSECLKWYRKASKVIDRQFTKAKTKAKTKTKADLEHPISACRCYMGRQLMERTLFADAFEIMSPVLDFSPDVVRLEMLQITLMLQWHDELYHVLGKGEPLIGIDDYIEAVAAFQIHGNSEVSCRLLNKGFRQLPEVARYITGQSMIPQVAPNEPALMASVAAARCILPAMRSKPGLVKWVRDTLNLKYSPEDLEISQRDSFDEPPGVDEVWEFHIVKQRGKTHLLCIEDQAPVHLEIFDYSPSNAERRDFLIRAMRFPAIGEPRKPREIRFDTRKTQQACRRMLENLDVESNLLEKDLFAKAMLKSLLEKMVDVSKLSDLSSPENSISNQELESIPVSIGLTWVVSIQRPPIWVTDQATPRRCWNIHVVDADSGMIVGLAQSETAFSPQQVFDELASMMLNRNPSLRPECLLIERHSDRELFDKVSEHMRCEVGDDKVSNAMLGLLHQMVENISQCRPAIDVAEGVTEEDIASYYKSAARFFKQSPWRLVQGDRVIGVRSLDFPDQHWGVSVIGQMGETIGLSITQGIDNALAMINGAIDITELNLMSIQFGENFDMVPTDLLMMEWRARDFASADAFPLLLKLKPQSRELFSPDRHEIQMATVLLNELPSFLKSNDNSSGEVVLQTPSGRRYSLLFES